MRVCAQRLDILSDGSIEKDLWVGRMPCITYIIFIQSGLAPLIPKVDAILVLDGDGNPLAGNYSGDELLV